MGKSISLKRKRKKAKLEKKEPRDETERNLNTVAENPVKKRRIRGVNRDNQVVGCKICGKRLAWKSMREHRKIHDPALKKFICKLCGQRFYRGYHLKEHERVHLPKDHESRQRFQCSQCGMVLARTYSLKRHIEAFHTDLKPQFPCDICGRLFRIESFVKEHKNRVHVERHKEKCIVCGQEFFSQKSLNSHLSMRHRPVVLAPPRRGKKSWMQCRFCHKTYFTYPAVFRKHEEDAHAEEKRFPCPKCGTKFAYRHTMRLHVRRIHDKERGYLCEQPECSDKAFFSPRELIIHNLRDHQCGRKPHKCPNCPYRSYITNCLRQHVRLKHKEQPPLMRMVGAQDTADPDDDVEGRPPLTMEKVHCDVCDYVAKNLTEYDLHKVHCMTEEEKKMIESGAGAKDKKRGKFPKPKKEYPCNFCPEVFRTKKERGSHAFAEHKMEAGFFGRKRVCIESLPVERAPTTQVVQFETPSAPAIRFEVPFLVSAPNRPRLLAPRFPPPRPFLPIPHRVRDLYPPQPPVPKIRRPLPPMPRPVPPPEIFGPKGRNRVPLIQMAPDVLAPATSPPPTLAPQKFVLLRKKAPETPPPKPAPRPIRRIHVPFRIRPQAPPPLDAKSVDWIRSEFTEPTEAKSDCQLFAEVFQGEESEMKSDVEYLRTEFVEDALPIFST